MVGSSKGSVNLPFVQSEPAQAFRLFAGSRGFSVGAIAVNGGDSGGSSCAGALETWRTARTRRIIPQTRTTRTELAVRIVGSFQCGLALGIATKIPGRGRSGSKKLTSYRKIQTVLSLPIQDLGQVCARCS